jgi:hypothetical protein
MPGRERRVGFERTVGAAGVNRANGARHDATIALHAAPHRDHGRMRRITCRQFLGIGQDDFHRPSRPLRQEVSHGKVDCIPLAPEFAADVDYVYADPFLRHA